MSELPKFQRPGFNPKRLDPCFCKSGKRFKNCCGSKNPNRAPPYGVNVEHNFISSEQCDDWIQRAETKEREALKVVDVEKSTTETFVLKLDPNRVTESVILGDLEDEMNQKIALALHSKIEPYYKRKIAWHESAVLLRYKAGGHYKNHADSDSYNNEHKLQVKTLDRDVSLLLYLNDDYEGGGIKFSKFNYRYQPKKGDLVFFPSDYRYMHEAEKVISGVRYAVVSWSALSKVPRVMSGRPENSIVLDEDGIWPD